MSRFLVILLLLAGTFLSGADKVAMQLRPKEKQKSNGQGRRKKTV